MCLIYVAILVGILFRTRVDFDVNLRMRNDVFG